VSIKHHRGLVFASEFPLSPDSYRSYSDLKKDEIERLSGIDDDYEEACGVYIQGLRRLSVQGPGKTLALDNRLMVKIHGDTTAAMETLP